MKLKTLLLLLLISSQGNSQVSVAPKHFGKPSKFKKGVLEKFKNTETIFLFSNVYEKEKYEKILNDSWDVTPYRIVDIENFDIENYLSKKYSIAQLTGSIKSVTSGSGGTQFSYLYTYIDFKMYDGDVIIKKLNKLSLEKRAKNRAYIINDNSSNIARFYLYPKDDFVQTAHQLNMNKIVGFLYSEDVFFNYYPGLLKNYFQKINNLIKNEEVYLLDENDYSPELKNLTINKLYIPSYMTIKHNGWKGKDSEEKDENIQEIFKKYNYQHEIISDTNLSNKIMNNEEFYYLRYVRVNVERFLQVVNSKTGEIIYRNYSSGYSFKIKTKQIVDLNSKIIKASMK